MLVEKEIIGPGEYWYVDERSGLPRKLSVTPELTSYWHKQGNKMLATGLTVPVPFEHDFNAHPMTPKDKLLNNSGWIKEYTLKDNKLFGTLDIQDEEIAKKLPTTIRWTSPWINSFTDGNGQKWNNVISHLALTTRPRITKQEPFGSIAAALSLATPVNSWDEITDGFCLSDAGLLLNGIPAHGMAFSIYAGEQDAFFSLEDLEGDELNPDIFLNLDEDVFANLEDDKEYNVILSIFEDGMVEGIALASPGDYYYAITGKRPSLEDTAGAANKAAGKGRTRDAIGRFASSLHAHAQKIHSHVTNHVKMLGEHVKRLGGSVREGVKNRYAQAKAGVGRVVSRANLGKRRILPQGYGTDIGREHAQAMRRGVVGKIKNLVGLSINDVFNKAVELGVDPTIALDIAMAGNPFEGKKKKPESQGGEVGDIHEPDEDDQPEDIDNTGDIDEGGGDIDLPPLGEKAGDVSMEEVLCDLLRALGVDCQHDGDEQQFKRNLYMAAMKKVHDLTNKGMNKEEQPKPGQVNKGNPPGSPGQQTNPLIQQEQQPMYMSLEDINKLPDPMKSVALAMYTENQKLRADLDASKKVTDSLRDAKIKEAGAARETRIAILSRLSPRVKADLEAMVKAPGMALSMGDGGVVLDPMEQTLAVLEKGLADIPKLLTTPSAAFNVQPHPTDEGEISAEEADKLADDLSRMMGYPPETKKAS